MMLHRHFEKQNEPENMTKLSDVTPKAEYVSEVFPPDEAAAEAPKRKGRKPKATE